jgi:cell division protein FtsL
MEKSVKKLESWAILFAVICLAMLWRIVYLQDELVETRHDLVSIEMEYQRLEHRSQFYMEQYDKVSEQRSYYYDRLVQITNNNEAQRYLEEN